MSNGEMIIVLVIFMATLIGCMMYFGKRDMRVRSDAEKLIHESRNQASNYEVPDETSFKKPQWISLLLFILSLFLIAIYEPTINAGTVNKAGKPVVFGQNIQMLTAMVPLLFAIRQWLYKVTLSDNGLRISSFTSRLVLYEDIDNIEIGAVKASTFCLIRLRGGEALMIGSDLVGFLDFVKLLSNRLNKLKGIS